MYNYLALLNRVLLSGNRRNTRAGPTISKFGQHFAISIADTFPAVTTKKLYFESCANELAGFLRAETDASKMGSAIWLQDAERWSGDTDMGRVYGPQMRDWQGPQGSIDQLRQVVDNIKEDPTSRRHLVTMWNPGELHLGCLPPCHYAFQFYVDNWELSLSFNMRSVDLMLGLPFDIAYYALLLSLVAQECDLTPNMLHAFLGDCHIYENHELLAKMQVARKPYALPTLMLDPMATIDNFTANMAVLKDYTSHPPINAILNTG
jgi:thymidylate synthase